MNFCIGVDLGGTNIAVGLVNLKSRSIIRKASIKTRAPRPCESISEDIVKLCRELCEKEGLGLDEARWIGVATPGIVKKGVVVMASNLGWNNAPFADIIKRLSGRPTFIANDANTAAYAEALWGVGADKSSLVAITLGTGVGGGIVIDGKIWEGINGFAAEIGHVILDADGRSCPCGKRGCFEAYSSATALLKETKRTMHLYPDSLMWKMCDGDINRVNGIIPFKAAAAGDEAAREVIDDFVKYLAIGISNVINIFQPDIVCIGGGISGEGERLMRPLRDKLERMSFGTNGGRTKVMIAKYMNDAGIIGGALLGMQDEAASINSRTQRIVESFDIKGEFYLAKPFGNGHINDTRYVETKDADGIHHYVLQKINKNVFKNPERLMDNYTEVTDYLRRVIAEAGGDPERETLSVIKALDGKNYHVDRRGEYWRLLNFIEDSMSYDKVERPEQFYESAVAFGNFQYLLRDYPADTLYETIPNFHNTPDRFEKFMEAVERDSEGRCAEVREEIEFVKARREFANTLENAHAAGRLPLRVTHNDTKLNNILFDKKTGKPICVVDLDTIMPGYSVCDFGDSIRFGATTALEDEVDLTKVNFDINLYELYVKGFIEGARGGLTETELELLPIGAIMLTYECGMRFLTDYISGDTYFKITREKHNLDRARNQFKLVSDMEKQLDKMREIVKKYSH